MGILGQKGISTIVDPKISLYWEIPDDWTMEEAATVPCVYSTVSDTCGSNYLFNFKLKENFPCSF